MIRKKIILLSIYSLLLFWSVNLFARDNSLKKIRQSGILRVCTTGDYPPFTQLKDDVYRGKDIAVAKAIAKSLGVGVKFVKTTWPTLEKDLTQGKCDIAMGGISITPSRAKRFLLTLPLLKFGKVPLVRCIDRKKYQTMKDIDKPNVRIVENAGGTNEQFARRHIKFAKLIIVKNNIDTFRYLLNNKADVMFTDSPEAIYRQKIMPSLCAINPAHPLTISYKVYLLPKGSQALLRVVNQILKQ